MIPCDYEKMLERSYKDYSLIFPIPLHRGLRFLLDFNLHPPIRVYQYLLYLLTCFFVRSPQLLFDMGQQVFFPHQLILAPAGCQMPFAYPFFIFPGLFLPGCPHEVLAAVGAYNLPPEIVGVLICKHISLLCKGFLNFVPQFHTHNTFMVLLYISSSVRYNSWLPRLITTGAISDAFMRKSYAFCLEQRCFCRHRSPARRFVI